MRLLSPRLLRPLAWLLLAAIAFVTLSPLELRPNSGLSPNYERLAAFAAVGCAFALAYPRHLWLVLCLVLGAALCLEALQFLAGSRHPRFVDLAAKLIGGSIGVGGGAIIHTAWHMLARRA